MKLHAVAAIALLGLVLTACSPQDGDRADSSEPALEQRALDDAPDGLRLPTPYEDRDIVAPDWEFAPQEVDGVFLSARPGERSMEFSAVDASGTLLWSAERPLSCSGFTVTRDANGRGIAVLPDLVSTSDALAQTTASGYDISTGELVWGPVEVPGPYRGPGTVFAYAPKSVVGENGPRLALDPATGEIVHDEEGSETQLIGEYRGTFLLADGRELFATDAEGKELWRLPAAEDRWLPSVPEAIESLRLAERFALVESVSGAHSLIDIVAGSVVAEGIQSAVVDRASGTIVMRDASSLAAMDAAGEELWRVTVSDDTEIAGLVDVFLYLREAGTIRVHNVLTGALAEGYPDTDGRIVYPLAANEGGAVLLSDEGRYLLIVETPLPDAP